MNIVTLRVEGSDEALDILVERLELKVDTRRKKGDAPRSGKPNSASGFSATLADNVTPREIKTAIEGFLALLQSKKIIFSESGLSAEIAIGLMVGSDRQFVAGVEFNPGMLRAVAELSLAIDVTAYPCSDEEPEIGSDT